MNEREIFNEILNSPKMKEILGVKENEEVNESYDATSPHIEVNVIRTLIEGKLRHTSDEGIFKSLLKLFDL